MKTMFLTAITVLMVACSGGQTTKAEDGGEKQLELKRQAASSAANAASDVCSANDWYGDGACDVFCADRDVDCSVKDVVCLLYIEEPNGVCQREPGDPCVAQDPDCEGLSDPLECAAIAMLPDGKCEEDPKNPCLRYQDLDCVNGNSGGPTTPSPGGGNEGSIPPSEPSPGGGNEGSTPSPPAGGDGQPTDPVPGGCTLLLEVPDGVCSRDAEDPCISQDPDCNVK
jgi:hypothetical protein